MTREPGLQDSLQETDDLGGRGRVGEAPAERPTGGARKVGERDAAIDELAGGMPSSDPVAWGLMRAPTTIVLGYRSSTPAIVFGPTIRGASPIRQRTSALPSATLRWA